MSKSLYIFVFKISARLNHAFKCIQIYNSPGSLTLYDDHARSVFTDSFMVRLLCRCSSV